MFLLNEEIFCVAAIVGYEWLFVSCQWSIYCIVKGGLVLRVQRAWRRARMVAFSQQRRGYLESASLCDAEANR